MVFALFVVIVVVLFNGTYLAVDVKGLIEEILTEVNQNGLNGLLLRFFFFVCNALTIWKNFRQ